MRLSDIKGDRAIDVIADIIEPITCIAEDETASNLFSRKPLPEGVSAKKFTLERIRKNLPALLKGHKDDIIAILSAIEGVEPKAYKGTLSLIKLTKDCVELLTDEAFTTLFISAQSEVSSGSAPENTKAGA